MATLAERIKADNAEREKAKQDSRGLLGGLRNAGRVVNAGLLNPNEYNRPQADRFKDSMFGLLGVVPGVGDAASAAESADLFNRGENFAGGLAALGALPMIPSLAGMVKHGGKAADALVNTARQPTKYELAHQVAQQNAVDMLGLPPGNTAMDRARAMGFNTPAYHGTTSVFDTPDLTIGGKASNHASAKIPAFWAGLHPRIPDLYTGKRITDEYPMGPYGPWQGRGIESVTVQSGYKPGANTIPIIVKYDKDAPVISAKEMDRLLFSGETDSRNAGELFSEYAKNQIDKGSSMVRSRGHYAMEAPELRQGNLAIFDPTRVRSRFAAFDPAKRDSSDLLAGVAPYAIPVAGAGLLGAAMMPDEAIADDKKKTKKKQQ